MKIIRDRKGGKTEVLYMTDEDAKKRILRFISVGFSINTKAVFVSRSVNGTKRKPNLDPASFLVLYPL
jgi:hypothetical protein